VLDGSQWLWHGFIQITHTPKISYLKDQLRKGKQYYLHLEM